MSLSRSYGNPMLDRAVRSVVETLEERRLLSTTPTLTNGVVDVTGTKGADVITVALNHDDASKLDVTVNGVVTEFDMVQTPVSGVRVDGRRGNDAISVDESNGLLPFGVTLLGGKGADSLTGGS